MGIIHSDSVCQKRKYRKFDIVWEDCIQEEAIVSNRESLLREDDQDQDIHTKGIKQSKFKKGNNKHSEKKFQNKNMDYSKYQCYNYHKIGHIPRECPSPKKNNNNKRHHAHLAEYENE